MVATTAGGTDKSFQAGGDNRYTMSEYLKPIQGTINKCSGVFLPHSSFTMPTGRTVHACSKKGGGMRSISGCLTASWFTKSDV